METAYLPWHCKNMVFLPLGIGSSSVNLLASMCRNHPDRTSCHQILDSTACQWSIDLIMEKTIERKIMPTLNECAFNQEIIVLHYNWSKMHMQLQWTHRIEQGLKGYFAPSNFVYNRGATFNRKKMVYHRKRNCPQIS